MKGVFCFAGKAVTTRTFVALQRTCHRRIASPLPASPHGTARKRPLRKVAGVLLSTDQYTIHRRRLLVKFVRARGRARALCVHIPFARAPSPARGLQLPQADGHLRRAFDSGVPGGEKGAEPRASRHTGRRGSRGQGGACARLGDMAAHGRKDAPTEKRKTRKAGLFRNRQLLYRRFGIVAI